MKVAIYHNLPSGGAKRALSDLVKHTSSDVDYDLFRIDLPANEAYLDIRPLVKNTYSFQETLPPPYYRLKGVRAFAELNRLKRLDKLQEKIAAKIDSGNYDFVFVHHCMFTQSPAILKYLQTPVIYYMQEPRRQSFEYNFSPHFTTGNSPMQWLRRHNEQQAERYKKHLDITCAKLATHVLCNSFYSAESIKRAYGIQATPSYLGVDISLFAPAGQVRTNQILSVGALYPVKGHELIIEALGIIPKASRPPLNIVYDREMPGYRETITAYAKERSVNLTLHSGISDKELVNLYSSCHATICAAELEPFGYTPLESMACGTPVIAVKEGGYRETVIDGENGRLSPRDPQKLAALIQKTGSENDILNSPNKLHQGIKHGWSTQSAGQRLLQTYNQFLNEKS